MKMKKIIVTGMAFLAAMTVFAGCGSAGKEETIDELVATLQKLMK